MPQNNSLRIPYLAFSRLACSRLVSIGIVVFIFMATNSVITLANVHVPAHKHTDTPKYFDLIRLFTLNKSQDPDSGDEGFKEHQTSDLKGQFVGSDKAVLEMIALVNQERVDTGLTKLEIDPTLMKLAGEKSWDMARFNYFGHYSKRLGTIYQQLDQAQFQYQKAAENIIGAPNPVRAVQTVMASPAHRSNLLNPHFQKVGIGIVKGGQYGEIIVQIFTG